MERETGAPRPLPKVDQQHPQQRRRQLPAQEIPKEEAGMERAVKKAVQRLRARQITRKLTLKICSTEGLLYSSRFHACCVRNRLLPTMVFIHQLQLVSTPSVNVSAVYCTLAVRPHPPKPLQNRRNPDLRPLSRVDLELPPARGTSTTAAKCGELAAASIFRESEKLNNVISNLGANVKQSCSCGVTSTLSVAKEASPSFLKATEQNGAKRGSVSDGVLGPFFVIFDRNRYCRSSGAYNNPTSGMRGHRVLHLFSVHIVAS